MSLSSGRAVLHTNTGDMMSRPLVGLVRQMDRFDESASDGVDLVHSVNQFDRMAGADGAFVPHLNRRP